MCLSINEIRNFECVDHSRETRVVDYIMRNLKYAHIQIRKQQSFSNNKL